MKYFDALNTALGPLVAGGFHPGAFPQPKTGSPVWPAIRGFTIDPGIDSDICGDGDEDNTSPRIQLDVVSLRRLGYAAHYALVRSVYAAMAAFVVPAVNGGEIGPNVDLETDTYRTILDYTLHGSG